MSTVALNQIVCLMLNVRLWTGRKKLELTDLKGVDASQIPPDKLASLGSKRIVDPDNLKAFNTLKKRAERCCQAVGTRFLGGYAIPESKIEELVNDLEEIKEQFLESKRQFMTTYDVAIYEWINVNREWEESIRAAAEPLSVIERRIGFHYQAFRVNELEASFIPATKDGLQEEVEGLGGQLLHEIRQQAKQTWEQSFVGKTEVGQRSLRPLVSMANKLEGLSFIDGRISTMVQSVHNCLDSLPKSGTIEGQNFNAVCGVLGMLMDERGIVRLPAEDWSLPTTSPDKEERQDKEDLFEQAAPSQHQKDPAVHVDESEPVEDSLTVGCSW